jgi:predicted dehydrogenase
MKKLRVGIIGLGDVWQQRHAPALHALTDRFDVRAICDQISHRADLVAEQFPNAMVIDGYHELTSREDIDAVMILSPQWYGALPVLAACESGKAVYCAAGLDVRTEDIESIKRRVTESGVPFMAEFSRRHAPATLRMKELIATRLGAPRMLFCHQRSARWTSANRLREDSPQSTSVRDLVGMVDWCYYLVGWPPSAVTGLMHAADSSPDEEDYQMMSLDFSGHSEPQGSGPIAQISCGHYMPAEWKEAITYRPMATLQVVCRRGVAFIDLPTTLVWFDETGRHQEALESERPVGEQLLSHFHRVVECPKHSTDDLEDACRSFSIVQQARESHRQGQRIEL